MKLAILTTNEHRYIEALKPDLVVTNNADSPVIEYCEASDIKYKIVDNLDFLNRDRHERAIKKILDSEKVDLVILGGYRRLITNDKFLRDYDGKMINVHLSYLPEFPGAKPHEAAFDAKVAGSGYTVHLVDHGVDTGEIIFQEKVNISDCKDSQEVYDRLVTSACLKIKGIVENL